MLSHYTHTCLTLLTCAGFVVVSISESKKLSHTPALCSTLNSLCKKQEQLKFEVRSALFSLSIRCSKKEQQTSTEVRSVSSPTRNSLSSLNFTWSSLSLCACVCVCVVRLQFCCCWTWHLPCTLSCYLTHSTAPKNSCRKLFIISICKGKEWVRGTREMSGYETLFVQLINVESAAKCLHSHSACQTVT